MMAHDRGWTDEREALESAELTSGVAAPARRRLPTGYRQRLLRAVVREILGDRGA